MFIKYLKKGDKYAFLLIYLLLLGLGRLANNILKQLKLLTRHSFPKVSIILGTYYLTGCLGAQQKVLGLLKGTLT